MRAQMTPAATSRQCVKRRYHDELVHTHSMRVSYLALWTGHISLTLFKVLGLCVCSIMCVAVEQPSNCSASRWDKLISSFQGRLSGDAAVFMRCEWLSS
jgi:hypothetical protein